MRISAFLKPILILILFLGGSTVVFGQGQSTYEIVPSQTMDVQKLENALKKCDLDRYRHMNIITEMKFKDGTVVQLFPAVDLMNKNIPVNQTKLRNTDEPIYNSFKLLYTGVIVEEAKTLSEIKNIKAGNTK